MSEEGPRATIRFFLPGEVHDGDIFSFQEAQVQPSIDVRPLPGHIYTVLMVDPDAPTGPFIHYLTINNGVPILSYLPPRPPSGTHRYYLFLFEQATPISIQHLGRERFDIENFTTKHNLHVVDHIYFLVKARES